MRLLYSIFAFFLMLFSPESATLEDNETTSQEIAVCGNKLCEVAETCQNCPLDCGLCKEDILKSIKESVVWIKYDYFAETSKNSYQYNSATGSGVIIEENENYLFVLSNRHVLDCRYTNSCSNTWFENMTIRTQDEISHVVERVSFDPQYLDIAYLRVRKSVDKQYQVAPLSTELVEGEEVIAAGYPASRIGGGIVEYSSKSGVVLHIKDLILPNGRKLESIESDAFTFYGSSGGGFFNEKGELVGISTWGIDLKSVNAASSIAIKITSLLPFDTFLSCRDGEYVDKDGSCKQYHGNNHRLVCFYTDQRTFNPLSGRIYYNGENQGKTIEGCKEIVITNDNDAIIEFDRDYPNGIIRYSINYTAKLKEQFATSWFLR